MKRITPMNGAEKDVNALLYGIHKELGSQNWRGLFVAGWEELRRANSPCAMTVYKVLFATGGVLAATFVCGSTTFGCLAMAEAVEEYEHTGKAPIIGHFSEWTMQALLAAVFSLRGPYEIARLGHIPKIEILFQNTMNRSHISRKEKVRLYEEKMHMHLRQSQNNLIAIPRLPNPGEMETGKQSDVLAIDFHLQAIYQEIEKELNTSGAHLVKLGWEEIKTRNRPVCVTALKAAAVCSTVFVLGQYSIYSMGIIWSAEQAVSDYEEGLNPSIGGHCLEWFAEMLGVGNAIFSLVSELANVGSYKWTVDVFRKHIEKMEEHKDAHWEKKGKRLREVMTEQTDKIPQGFVFSLPTYYRFGLNRCQNCAAHNCPQDSCSLAHTC